MKEKWNLGLRFDQNSPIKEADLSDKQIQAIKESARRDVSVEIRTELKKTVEEERMINRINEAIKIFFDALICLGKIDGCKSMV